MYNQIKYSVLLFYIILLFLCKYSLKPRYCTRDKIQAISFKISKKAWYKKRIKFIMVLTISRRYLRRKNWLLIQSTNTNLKTNSRNTIFSGLSKDSIKLNNSQKKHKSKVSCLKIRSKKSTMLIWWRKY